jgi:Cytochrome P450
MTWNDIDLWLTVSKQLSLNEQLRHFLDLFAVVCVFVIFIALLFILTIFWKRKRAYECLTRAGLPVTYWYPKWISSSSTLYKESSAIGRNVGIEDLSYNILSSKNVTNILPRMLRMHGPYDMYGILYGASTAVVHVAHPTPAHAILCGGGSGTKISVPITQKAPAYNHFKNFCGHGVFTADGEDWKNKRAAVLHALLMRNRPTISETEERTATRDKQSQPAEMGFYSRIAHESNRSASELIDTLDKKIQSLHQNCLEATYRTNMVPILQRATIGLIYRYITHNDVMKAELCTNDKNCDSETKVKSFIQKYLQSITRIRMILLAQSRSIWFVLPRWFYRSFAKLYRDEEDSLQSIRQMAILACQSAQPNSPLGQLRYHPVYCATQNKLFSLSKTMKNDSYESSVNDFSKNLVDEAITLLFAGQDTSAATLSWTLHLLTLHPNVQETLFAEIQSVLKDDSDYDEDKIGCPAISRKHLARMPFLDAIIKESMRLYPVAPFIVRNLSEDVDLSPVFPAEKERIQYVRLPSNSVACIWIYSLHRHPDFWNQPNDFLPERWLASQTMASHHGKASAVTSTTKDLGITTPGAYIPYAIGVRNCLGQPLANIVLRIILARLIFRYEFLDDRVAAVRSENPTPNEPLSCKQIDHLRRDMQAGFTVLPQGGLPLSIRHRK